jgi:hypothetical protein
MQWCSCSEKNWTILGCSGRNSHGTVRTLLQVCLIVVSWGISIECYGMDLIHKWGKSTGPAGWEQSKNNRDKANGEIALPNKKNLKEWLMYLPFSIAGQFPENKEALRHDFRRMRKWVQETTQIFPEFDRIILLCYGFIWVSTAETQFLQLDL